MSYFEYPFPSVLWESVTPQGTLQAAPDEGANAQIYMQFKTARGAGTLA